MNIDKLIIPRFKRFKQMGIGLKRLLFVLTFPFGFLGFLVLIGSGVLFLFDDHRSYILSAFISGISFGGYFVFWILVRVILWVYDGYNEKEPEVI